MQKFVDLGTAAQSPPRTYEEARCRAVKDELDYLGVEGDARSSSQLRWWLDEITKSAAAYAETSKADLTGSDWTRPNSETILLDAARLMSDLRTAVNASSREGPQSRQRSVWQHTKNAHTKCREDWGLNRPEVERLVGSYIDLPYRSNKIDRLFIDLLIFMEMNALGYQLFGEYDKTTSDLGRALIAAGHLPVLFFVGESRLNPTKYFLGVLDSIGASLILALSLIWITSRHIITIVAVSPYDIKLAYFVVGLAAFSGLVYALIRRNILVKRRATAQVKLAPLLAGIERIGEVYADLQTNGPISVRRMLERVHIAAESHGIVWPPPLYALLDDIQSRSVHL